MQIPHHLQGLVELLAVITFLPEVISPDTSNLFLALLA